MPQGPQDGRLHLVRSGLRLYLGQRSGCEGYMIYIYYPFFGQFTFTLMTAAVFVVLYAILWLFLFAVRNRTLLENQQALLESSRHLTETVQMLKSLEAVYFALFYVNLKEDSYRAIYIAVQGYLRMGAPHPEDFALQADCRDKAAAALGTLLELVNNVLDMSELESGEILLEKRPFDLQKTLDEVNALTASQVNRRGVYQQSLRTGPLPERFLIGGPKHLRQA